MVKVTLNDNLVPSTRDLWVQDNPSSDLTHHYALAKKLIRAASHFFHLTRNAVIFSGYVHEESADPFSIHLWHEGELVRTLTLSNLGYSGTLHAETVGGRFTDIVGWDLLGTLTSTSPARIAAASI
jgi:hypothetical protein